MAVGEKEKKEQLVVMPPRQEGEGLRLKSRRFLSCFEDLQALLTRFITDVRVFNS